MSDVLTALALAFFAFAIMVAVVVPTIAACKKEIIEIIMAIKRRVP